MKTLQTIATGLSYGALVDDNHASLAVLSAIKKMHPCTIGSVLLFLSVGYSHHPQNAIKAAAKAAGTPQVFGCCAMGLLTDEDWLLDVEGAVAMVFPLEHSLQALKVARNNLQKHQWTLTLTSPDAAQAAINSSDTMQIGALASDEYGHGPFSIWQSGQIAEQEFTQTVLSNESEHIIDKAESIRRISPLMQINKTDSNKLLEIDQQVAIENIKTHLPTNLSALGLEQPYNLIAAISETKERESIEAGHYNLLHVIPSNKDDKHVALSGTANSGHYMFWALRDEQRAQQIMRAKLKSTKNKFKGDAKFALMFPNISRGAEFYNGRDKDFEIFKEVFPTLPMIGFYGHGEIAPAYKTAGSINYYSTVFGLFS